MAPPPKQEGPRANNQINVPDVRLIDAEGENVGVVATDRAMEMGQEGDVVLVEMSPTAKPAVDKMMG